jgi:hypothetical protein
LASLLEDLAHRGLLGLFLSVGLPLGQGPVVVSGAVGDEDPELAFGCLAEDDTPGGSNKSCHGGEIRCEWP